MKSYNQLVSVYLFIYIYMYLFIYLFIYLFMYDATMSAGVKVQPMPL